MHVVSVVEIALHVATRQLNRGLVMGGVMVEKIPHTTLKSVVMMVVTAVHPHVSPASTAIACTNLVAWTASILLLQAVMVWLVVVWN